MSSVFVRPPGLVERSDVSVMEQSTVDELSSIQEIWPSFERLVGVRGRKMYGRADERRHTYTACTPLRRGDEPELLGLALGTLAGGRYLRGRIVGEAPGIYELITVGMAELRALVTYDEERPLVEYYRRHDQIELWVPTAG